MYTRPVVLECHTLGYSKGLLYCNVIIEYKIHAFKISMNVFHGATCRKDDLQWENNYIHVYG